MTNDVARAERMVARALDLVAEEPHRPVAVHVRLRQLELATKHSTPRDLLGAWEQLAEEARRVGAIEAQYHARWHLGVCHARLGEVGRAVTLEDECHALAEQSLPRELGKSTVNIGEALGQGRYHVPAERLLGTAIDLALERDLERMAHYGAAVLARVHLERGRWDQARHTATRWEDHEQDEAGATRGITLAVLGRLDAHQGVVGAAGRVATAWQDVRGTGDLDFLWPTAVASAEAAWIHGDPTAAADVVLATLDLARMTGHPWAVGELTWWARQAGHDVPLTIEVAGPWAAALVGDWATAAEAWEALGCPLDEAIALTAGDVAARRRALDLFIDLDAFADADRLRQSLREAGVTDLPVRDRTRAKPDAITDRQREVLELVAAGLTNADIAQHLYISEKTVGHHVSAILQRLDVRTRTQAVTVARRRGLLTD
jgi:DNA-binding CsgD family transcriptional regulator